MVYSLTHCCVPVLINNKNWTEEDEIQTCKFFMAFYFLYTFIHSIRYQNIGFQPTQRPIVWIACKQFMKTIEEKLSKGYISNKFVLTTK